VVDGDKKANDRLLGQLDEDEKKASALVSENPLPTRELSDLNQDLGLIAGAEAIVSDQLNDAEPKIMAEAEDGRKAAASKYHFWTVLFYISYGIGAIITLISILIEGNSEPSVEQIADASGD
jgi:hypothetical protein